MNINGAILTVRHVSLRFASKTVPLSLRKQFGVCSFACAADRPRAINRRIFNLLILLINPHILALLHHHMFLLQFIDHFNDNDLYVFTVFVTIISAIFNF